VSSWDRRKSSGEIINATLLEVFLILVFVVFALAVFERQRLDAAVAAKEGWASAEEVRALKDSLRRAQVTLRKTNDSVVFLTKLFQSRYPPDCEPGAVPAAVVTIGILGKGLIRVEANRSFPGMHAGDTVRVALNRFQAVFSAARRESGRQGCRYLAQIRDIYGASKADFKLAGSVINTVFRPRDIYK
jgi:hypothetical protein